MVCWFKCIFVQIVVLLSAIEGWNEAIPWTHKRQHRRLSDPVGDRLSRFSLLYHLHPANVMQGLPWSHPWLFLNMLLVRRRLLGFQTTLGALRLFETSHQVLLDYCHCWLAFLESKGVDVGHLWGINRDTHLFKQCLGLCIYEIYLQFLSLGLVFSDCLIEPKWGADETDWLEN